MKFSKFYDKNYKVLLFFMLALLVITIIYLYSFNVSHGDVLIKDISLTGGTSLTVNVVEPVDVEELRFFLDDKFDDFSIREISDLRTGKQVAFVVEVNLDPEEVQEAVEDFLDFDLDGENSSVEFTGSSLGEGFYNQLRIAIIIAFILMSVVVFIIFRTFVPSLAVILSAFADIAMTAAVINLLGVKVSSAGIVAFLMLIGYSVDSDILLTTRMIKNRDGTLNDRMFGAFKTGMTMTLTSLAAVLISLIIVFRFSDILAQIFTIISIGLVIDIFNTWLANASILKWYASGRNK